MKKKAVDMDAATLVVSAKRAENGAIQLSFDAGSAVSSYWLSEDEVLELINDLMDSVSAKRPR